MKTFTYSEVKNNFSKILDIVMHGEKIVISKKRSKEPIAVIVPYQKFSIENERPLGILKGKASYKMKNFKLTDEEFLAL